MADDDHEEENVHGRDLRARGVASVDEYVDLLGYPAERDRRAAPGDRSRALPAVREDIKWHVPVYSLGTTPIVSIEGFKCARKPEVLRGRSELEDHAGILEGTGKGVRHVKFRSTGDVDEAIILVLIDEALGRRS